MPRTTPIQIPYANDYPDILAICCSDGRYIEAIGRFLEEQQVPRHDLLALPGGPAALCRATGSYNETSVLMDAFDLLVRSHKTRRVILIAHEHCGYYRHRLRASEENRQVKDLEQARERILLSHRQLAVRLCFARPRPGEPAGFVLDEFE